MSTKRVCDLCGKDAEDLEDERFKVTCPDNPKVLEVEIQVALIASDCKLSQYSRMPLDLCRSCNRFLLAEVLEKLKDE